MTSRDSCQERDTRDNQQEFSLRLSPPPVLHTTDRVSLGPSRVQYFTAGFTFHNALHIAVIIPGHVTLTHIWLIALEVWKLLLRS